MSADEEGSGGGTVVQAAILWVIVLAGLAYGVIATLIKVPALFGA
jgi:hypothetical protein